ncbi:ABC transporter ATP-binding protein [Ectobacillus antri]|jgi:acetoin utilization transport system ATP-binding protein|uniref:ABC transporter ATP-binding protein n=1 Tax=Ectobacillus antri TaxID=2486280 RepID=A0ABT6H3N9_9BACI|nr:MULTISPECIES: ABC transporter ATP-binding protein [Ectobacillus]MDG4656331.1 ABC transporter ATP-binding protein [Ectobacillus antri]MDG5753006.1 ABC transporter ATP-binding protein [Ectobacillus antri]UOY92841.1 ABC transporter ATP-binding protein [Ectobacillus sp. JY-23]
MIEMKHISHSFRIGRKGKEQIISVLREVSLTIHKGEVVTIVGKSGSGKSTLLNLLSGFISPDTGSIRIDGTDVTKFNEKQWAKFRLDHFGFIFQNFQLIPGLTAYENIELPLTLKGMTNRKERVTEILERVGLTEVQDHFPNELSGGQQQRVSIARALVTKPSIIFADEPTGSLDSETEKEILKLIRELNEEQDITFVMITHDEEVASIGHRKLHLADGQLVKEGVLLEA